MQAQKTETYSQKMASDKHNVLHRYAVLMHLAK